MKVIHGSAFFKLMDEQKAEVQTIWGKIESGKLKIYKRKIKEIKNDN